MNENEPKPEAAVPECPPDLSPAARREWDRLIGELSALRMLTNLDGAALAALLRRLRALDRGHRAIQPYGAMIKSPQGSPIQSPCLAIANRQSEIMMRIASEFGPTPARRSRIATPAPSTERTLFD